jgi:hypothetical protein
METSLDHASLFIMIFFFESRNSCDKDVHQNSPTRRLFRLSPTLGLNYYYDLSLFQRIVFLDPRDSQLFQQLLTITCLSSLQNYLDSCSHHHWFTSTILHGPWALISLLTKQATLLEVLSKFRTFLPNDLLDSALKICTRKTGFDTVYLIHNVSLCGSCVAC